MGLLASIIAVVIAYLHGRYTGAAMERARSVAEPEPDAADLVDSDPRWK